MRCVKCQYSCFNFPKDSYECSLGFEIKKDSKGESGCSFNKKTINKIININWSELDKRIVAEYELMLDREFVNFIQQDSKMEK